MFEHRLRTYYRRLMQWGLRRLYHEFACSYDLVAAVVSGGFWQHWATAALPLLQPGLTIELGCGTGYLQQALALRKLPHLGIDLSPQMLRQARLRLRAGGHPLRLVRATALQLPLPDQYAANVVASFPAPYILEPQTLHEIARVLQPGGQLLMIDRGTFAVADSYTAAIDLAYRATLQASQQDPRPGLLTSAGLVVSEQWLTVGQTQVWVLRGETR